MSGAALRWLASLVRIPSRPGATRLTIVRHHRVYAAGEQPLYRLGVSETVLAEQLALLAGAGLSPVTVAEGVAWLAQGTAGHRVAMSFDDGYADNVDRALPLLKAAGARATFYLTAGLIEQRRAPWWDELAFMLERAPATRFTWRFAAGDQGVSLEDRASRVRAMAAIASTLRLAPEPQREALESLRGRLGVTGAPECALATWGACRALSDAGMEIGAHTLTHPSLSLLPEKAQREEVVGSVDLIASRLGVRPTGLAYPGGDHDVASIAACEAAGLAYAVTTQAGDNGPGAGRFELRRRGWSEGACLGPDGRFSRRLARAEIDGAFDRMRGVEATP
jgi:peptidoglycan/xylan/chitin deacetylase (PgdA/CDA1 family)